MRLKHTVILTFLASLGLTQVFAEERRVSLVSSLRIREEPNISGKVLGKIDKGEMVWALRKSTYTQTIDGIQAPWLNIETSSAVQGWVFGGYMSTATVTAPSPSRQDIRLKIINEELWSTSESSEPIRRLSKPGEHVQYFSVSPGCRLVAFERAGRAYEIALPDNSTHASRETTVPIVDVVTGRQVAEVSSPYSDPLVGPREWLSPNVLEVFIGNDFTSDTYRFNVLTSSLVPVEFEESLDR